MTVVLRNYQKKAVDELYCKFSVMLESPGEICVLKSPTGSGKTVMVANLLKKLVKEKKNYKISIIWIAPRKLHVQSKEKIEEIYDDQILKCSYFEDLQDNKIDQNEILFFNWDSINQSNNIYIRDNEQNRNLSKVIENTKDEGNKLILIIDESHFAAKSENSLELIHDLSPDITLEVSATPHVGNLDELCTIRLDHVIKEEMIKNEIIVNREFLKIRDNESSHKLSVDEIIINEALKRRSTLKILFEKEDSYVNPLLLIQIPDKKSSIDDKLDVMIRILEENKITEENGKLAIWLSEEKSDTLLNIEEENNSVEVLIFKQAISIGWDCPRASILVVFREHKSVEFTIQTIGRIMRMPELKHYQNDDLNKGYIFTNFEEIKLIEEYVKEYVSINESFRNEVLYKPIKLKSVHLKRQREKTRLSGEFIKIFNSDSRSKSLKSKVDKEVTRIIKPIISDGIISNIDKEGEIEFKGKLKVSLSESDVQERFDDFIYSACLPSFAPHDSSHRLKTALYIFLEREFGCKKYSKESQMIVLGNQNHQIFLDAINDAIEEYKVKVIQRSKKREVEIIEEWEVPKMMSFNDNYSKIKTSKSIMNPFYTSNTSEPEKKFIERLESSDNVRWWYKNGESEKKYFSVPYTDENDYELGFYVDFVIQMNDGKIGLFDTKSGATAAGASARHDGLYRYLQDETKKGKKLFGGIAVEKNGTWRYYDGKKYRFDQNSVLPNWKILDF